MNADCVLIGEAPADRRPPRGDGRAARVRARCTRRARRRAGDDDRPARLHRAWRGTGGAGRGVAAERVKLVRYADRPDLREIRVEQLSKRTFPEFMHHNESGGRYWDRLYDGASRLPAGAPWTATSWSLSSTRCHWPGMDRSTTCPQGGTTRSPAPSRAAARRTRSRRSRSRWRRSSRAGTVDRMLEAMRDAGRAAGLRCPHRAGPADREAGLPADPDRALHGAGGGPTARTSIPGSASTSASAAS